MRECIKEQSFKLSSGWSTCCQIHKLQSWCPWWDPWHWDSVWPDKDKKGWVLRSYDNNSYFDEKSVPHSIRAAPAARARELRLKYEPRCHCLISRGPGTQHLPYIVVCRPGRQVRCKVTPSRECFVVGKCKKSAFWDNTPHMSQAIWTDQSLSVMVLLTFTKTAF